MKNKGLKILGGVFLFLFLAFSSSLAISADKASRNKSDTSKFTPEDMEMVRILEKKMKDGEVNAPGDSAYCYVECRMDGGSKKACWFMCTGTEL